MAALFLLAVLATRAPVPGVSCTAERVVVVGASGYIGRCVVADAARRGYRTTAVVRNVPDRPLPQLAMDGVCVVQADVCDQASLERGPFAPGAADVVICCLASRQGTARDAEAIDYEATMNCVRAALTSGCRHFVLLSAICVRSAERREEKALHFQVRRPRSTRRPAHNELCARGQFLAHSGCPQPCAHM